jgi:hypothetical protein
MPGPGFYPGEKYHSVESALRQTYSNIPTTFGASSTFVEKKELSFGPGPSHYDVFNQSFGESARKIPFPLVIIYFCFMLQIAFFCFFLFWML